MPGERVEKQERTIIPTPASDLMRRRREALFGKGRFKRETIERDVTIERHPTKRGENSSRKIRPARRRKQIMDKAIARIQVDTDAATESPC